MAAPRGRLRPSGARESPLFGGVCFNQDISKIQKNVTTTLAYYIIRIAYRSYCTKSKALDGSGRFSRVGSGQVTVRPDLTERLRFGNLLARPVPLDLLTRPDSTHDGL